jgi:hypothetical protein
MPLAGQGPGTTLDGGRDGPGPQFRGGKRRQAALEAAERRAGHAGHDDGII